MPRRHALIAAAAIGLQPFNGYTVVGPVSVADLALFGALAAIGATQLSRRDGWLAGGVRPLGLLFAALTVWLAVVGSGWHTTQFLAFALVITTVGVAVRDSEDIRTVLWGALAGSVVISLLTLYSIFFDPTFGGRVAGSRGIGPLPQLARTVGVPIGSFGSFATYALAPLGYALVRWHRTRDWRLAAAGVIIVGMVVVHQTRATYLALAALLGVVVVGIYGRQLWVAAWRYAGVSVVGLAAFVAAAVTLGWVLFRVNAANALSRFAQFDRAFELIALYPFTGVTPPVLPYFAATGAIPHNVVLLVGVVGGFPAVVLLFSTFAVAIAGQWNAWTAEDTQTRDLALGIAAGWAATLTSLSLAPGFTRAFWFLIGLSAVLVGVRNGQLRGTWWSQPATESSSFARGVQKLTLRFPTVRYPGHTVVRRRLRSAVHRSVILGRLRQIATKTGLTYDASSVRERVEMAWKHSTVLSGVRYLSAAVETARVTRLLRGRSS